MSTTWLDGLPNSWDVAPVKSLFLDVRERNNPDDVHLTPSQTFGVLPQSKYMEITGTQVVLNLAGQNNMKHVEQNDFVIHLRSFQGGIEHSNFTGKVSSAYTVLRPQPNVYPAYFRRLLKSESYIQELRTTTNQLRDGQSIRFADFSKVPLPLPPLEEQRAIADYLDRETAQIDELISKQEALIKTLRERRRATFFRLHAHVGVGDRLKWLLTPVDERAGERAATLPLLSVSISWGVRERDALRDGESKADDLSKYKTCEAGDLVVNRMRAFQGALGVAPVAGIVSPDYLVLRTASSLDSRWLSMLMRTPKFVGEMTRLLRGIGGVESGFVRTPRINLSELTAICVDPPSLTDQKVNIEAFDEQTTKIDLLIKKAQQFVELAKERRAALITAAVTGQIDVRGEAA